MILNARKNNIVKKIIIILFSNIYSWEHFNSTSMLISFYYRHSISKVCNKLNKAYKNSPSILTYGL